MDEDGERRGGKAQRAGRAVSGLLEALLRTPRAQRSLALTGAWSRAVGPRMARAARPLRLTDGILRVQVESPVWRNELRMRTAEVLERLRRELGDAVRELDIRVGVHADERAVPDPSLEGARRPAMPALAAVAGTLETPELRELALALAEGREPKPAEREAPKRPVLRRRPGSRAPRSGGR